MSRCVAMPFFALLPLASDGNLLKYSALGAFAEAAEAKPEHSVRARERRPGRFFRNFNPSGRHGMGSGTGRLRGRSRDVACKFPAKCCLVLGKNGIIFLFCEKSAEKLG